MCADLVLSMQCGLFSDPQELEAADAKLSLLHDQRVTLKGDKEKIERRIQVTLTYLQEEDSKIDT
jgi:hypothetical protein